MTKTPKTPSRAKTGGRTDSTKAPPRPRASAAKPAIAIVASASPAVAVTAAAPKAEARPAPATAGSVATVVRKKDFVARVLAVSGTKKKDSQTVIEAVLRVMGEALSKGESLVLPPLGRARVSRQSDKSGADLLVVKLRRGGGGKPGKGSKIADEALAEAQD